VLKGNPVSIERVLAGDATYVNPLSGEVIDMVEGYEVQQVQNYRGGSLELKLVGVKPNDASVASTASLTSAGEEAFFPDECICDLPLKTLAYDESGFDYLSELAT
jgi:hypothetical protein